MKKILTLTALTTAISLSAQDLETFDFSPTPETLHHFSPKFFFRNHKEEGYEYQIMGGGFEYSLNRSKGFNYRISAITNAKKNMNSFVESEHSLFYRIPLNNTLTLYPLYSQRICNHHQGKHDGKDYYINKHIAYLGLGCLINPDETFQIRLETHYFQDLFNGLSIHEDDVFWGQRFYNPMGLRGKIGLNAHLIKNLFFDIESHFSQTFKKCYKEYGFEIALKWGF